MAARTRLRIPAPRRLSSAGAFSVPELVKLASCLQNHCPEPTDGVGSHDPIVFTRLAGDVADRAVADASHTHANHDSREIGDLDSRREEKSKHAVVVGGNSIAGIKAADTFVDRSADVERRMG